jgi:hypothetical protein
MGSELERIVARDAWERLVEFMADEGLTVAEIRAGLEKQGVDVDAFLERIMGTVKKHGGN